jgi:PAS domain S-box-containing protein
MDFEKSSFLKKILDNVNEGVIFTDPEGKIKFINEMAQNITEWSLNDAQNEALPLVFKIYNEKTNHQYVDLVESTLNTNKEFGIDVPIFLKTRKHHEKNISCRFSRLLGENSEVIGLLVIFQDITTKLEFEKEFKKALRLNSLGKLSGGIAHDFNNVLTTILGNISLAKLDLSQEGEIFALLSDAELGIEKARKMTEQLLSFSTASSTQKTIINFASVLKEFVSFTLSGSNVTCEFSIEDDLWNIQADKSQINQVIHNITINAVQSMPIGGTIKIEAENITFPENNEFHLEKGEYLQISIQDRGIGIDPVEIPHIFDPFFKSGLTGKGMGLTVVHDIIKQHQGHILIESELDLGTNVVFYLPAVKPVVQDIKKTIVKESRHTGRILIMDDEDVIRRVLSKMLTQLGYQPTAVANGENAIQAFAAHLEEKNPFAAVILDLTIRGGMGGEETVKNLLALDPKAKIIASSGYSTGKIITNYSDYGFSGILVKPYKMDELDEILTKTF